jgi:hypothetical protein
MGVPSPRILAADLELSEIQFSFVILQQLPGSDLCQIYQTLKLKIDVEKFTRLESIFETLIHKQG